jgi:regulator-associated protein of mTOR
LLIGLVEQESRLKDFGSDLMAGSGGDDNSPYYTGASPSPSSPEFAGSSGSKAAGGARPEAKSTKFEQRTILNIENAQMTNHVMFHTFLDILAVSDGEEVGVWNLSNGSRVMNVRPPPRQSHIIRRAHSRGSGSDRPSREFLDRGGSDPRVTAMQWVNESHDALLMLGADNGTVTLWRDTSVSDTGSIDGTSRSDSSSSGSISRGGGGSGGDAHESTSIASGFFALPDVADTTRGSGLVMSWQQSSGTLVVGGNSNTLRLWDLGREQCVRVFSTGFDTCTTALASRAVTGPEGEKNLSWTFAGFADGSIAVFDERVQGTGCVSSAREHSAWVVSAQFRPDVPEIITGSVRGTVKFWDLRTMRSVKTLEVHKSPLTALAVHPCAPIMATGSHAQFIKILTLGGEQLGGIIKYHDGFLGQRIGPVSCLAFHPVKMMLAMGATDSIVSVYQRS